MMIRKIAVAATAVLITASTLAYAAEPSSTVGMRQPSAADLKALTDARVGIIKAALQLTPDQEKYWPAVEEAIRARAKNRQARFERVAELRDSGAMEAAGERNAVELMQRRAERLINVPLTSRRKPMHGSHSIRRWPRIRRRGWPSPHTRPDGGYEMRLNIVSTRG